jgi:hypothetical protein
VATDGAISLQTLVCDIKTKSGINQVIVLLDSGSNSSLIDQALVSKLKAKVIEGPIVRKVNYVDGRVEVRSDQVYMNLSISTTNCPEQFLLGLLKTWQKRIILWIGQKQKGNLNILKMSVLLFSNTGQNKGIDRCQLSQSNAKF